MNANTIRAAGPVTIVDCPLCDAPAPFDVTGDAFDCAACGASLPLAAEPFAAPTLAAAA
jgi:hypothetical protein